MLFKQHQKNLHFSYALAKVKREELRFIMFIKEIVSVCCNGETN
jgi:hypothetical protein